MEGDIFNTSFSTVSIYWSKIMIVRVVSGPGLVEAS